MKNRQLPQGIAYAAGFLACHDAMANAWHDSSRVRMLLLASCMLAFLPLGLRSQQDAKIRSEFVSSLKLRTITDQDSIKQIEREIEAMYGNQARGAIRSWYGCKKWELLYAMTRGYMENSPGADTGPVGLPPFQRKGDALLQVPDHAASIAGHRLFSMFGVSKVRFPIAYVPAVYERGSRFNGEWTAIRIHHAYLMIRYVSSYPDGNQTSWYHEEAYYFRAYEQK